MASYFEKLFEEGSKDGISMVIESKSDYDIPKKAAGDDYYCFKFMEALKGPATGVLDYWLCIKKKALPKQGKVTLLIPQRFAGNVIGKGGAKVKQIAKELGVSYIKVEAY